MKPNDKAYREFMRVYTKTHVSIEAQVMASLTAAYDAQFQSEDYAGLVRELRDASHCHQCVAFGAKAADALEAALAERNWWRNKQEETAKILGLAIDAILNRPTPVDGIRCLTPDEQDILSEVIRRAKEEKERKKV